MSHEDRKPICKCENPEPKDLTEGLDALTIIVCNKCSGVIE